MTTQQLIAKILEDTYTLNKLKVRVPLLKDFLVATFFGSIEEYKKEMSAAEAAWLESLGPDFFNSFNKTNVYQILAEAEKYLDNLKPLVIYLPIIIPSTELTAVGKKLRADYGHNYIFELKFDPNLIAGCALVWNGVYKDYSLRSSIELKKKQILESFKQFVNK
jgi:hypothetical protein